MTTKTNLVLFLFHFNTNRTLFYRFDVSIPPSFRSFLCLDRLWPIRIKRSHFDHSNRFLLFKKMTYKNKIEKLTENRNDKRDETKGIAETDTTNEFLFLVSSRIICFDIVNAFRTLRVNHVMSGFVFNSLFRCRSFNTFRFFGLRRLLNRWRLIYLPIR